MNTKQTGDTSEAAVIAELIGRGYTVSIPFGDNDPYDLVVDSAESLHRVQVKTGWIEDGCLRFKTGSKTTEDGSTRVTDYSPEDVDAFAIRCRDTETLYWVPIAIAGKKNTYLRIDPAQIEHPNITRAEGFLFDAALPDV
ncbi:uncharacterized protein Nmlp_1091 [Natronomonas moolapensis 8.8.11]|jgi:hypothetical protein|uniref:PD(D/E)XK endonuclease domain-containing protein n=1 Tax=Natronomonas moolapensis (strain DSM 18674 / CECT 7526 / JCM 14361 / 8.8.11) TaxID=268739 RepID=M1XN28_NATM8|nr:group I intron-associated PD-(D/E)XK endonuclease [Natronomonas moolapensis]CCQ35302.1 uncharacterized protein Nmlp_1091 [Natronomonas moolapensis 8.8.11]